MKSAQEAACEGEPDRRGRSCLSRQVRGFRKGVWEELREMEGWRQWTRE